MIKNNYIIRLEKPCDYRNVENLTREAFWNVNVPGCDEHYLVHIMRNHKDFIPELDLVLEIEDKIIGNVMYTKSKLVNEKGNEKQIITFGPISILPEYQRQGYSRILLEYSFEKALNMGFDTIVIFGNPDNYVSRGFKSCKKYNVCLEGNIYPTALLVKELKTGVLDGEKWFFCESPVFYNDIESVKKFDSTFPFKEKKWQPSQEEFYIHSNSIMR